MGKRMTAPSPTPSSPDGPWGDVDRFARALTTASRLHNAQYRKGTSIPYVSHLLGTCSIALEYGADQDQAIAALLHDVIEDVEPVETARAEVAAFGPEVLRIVEACTDTDTHPKPPWRERKKAYVERLAHEDGKVLLVSASDKLHNARAIVRDLREHGAALWERFNPESDQLWYYQALVAAFMSNEDLPRRLVEELSRTVDLMGRLAVPEIEPDERRLGVVEVDSGTLLIGDPTYLLPDPERGKQGLDYSVVFSTIEAAAPVGGQPVLLLQRFGGDGSFPVTGTFEDGELVRATVDFDDPGDEPLQ